MHEGNAKNGLIRGPKPDPIPTRKHAQAHRGFIQRYYRLLASNTITIRTRNAYRTPTKNSLESALQATWKPHQKPSSFTTSKPSHSQQGFNAPNQQVLPTKNATKTSTKNHSENQLWASWTRQHKRLRIQGGRTYIAQPQPHIKAINNRDTNKAIHVLYPQQPQHFT